MSTIHFARKGSIKTICGEKVTRNVMHAYSELVRLVRLDTAELPETVTCDKCIESLKNRHKTISTFSTPHKFNTGMTGSKFIVASFPQIKEFGLVERPGFVYAIEAWGIKSGTIVTKRSVAEAMESHKIKVTIERDHQAQIAIIKSIEPS